MFGFGVRVEIGADLGAFGFLLLLYIENMDIETFVLSKGLVSLKSARVSNEGLRFDPDARQIRTN